MDRDGEPGAVGFFPLLPVSLFRAGMVDVFEAAFPDRPVAESMQQALELLEDDFEIDVPGSYPDAKRAFLERNES